MSQTEIPIWAISNEELKLRLASIEKTQAIIDSLLNRIKATSNIRANGDEGVPEEYKKALNKLFYVLFHLPETVRCISLSITFPFLNGEPKNNLDYSTRNLQSYLLALNPQMQISPPHNMEYDFVFQRPYMPSELEESAASHGSDIRRLNNQVIQPLDFGRSGDINLFNVRPNGLCGMTGAIANISTIDYPVPIRFTTSIRLHQEELLLTPLMQHTGKTDPNTGLEAPNFIPINL